MSRNIAKIDKCLGKNKVAATINETTEMESSIVVVRKNSIQEKAFDDVA